MATSRHVVERVRALLRLAANNPNEEEARSAAVHAARLIATHKLTVTDADPDTAEGSRRVPFQAPTRVWWMRRHDKVSYTIVLIILAFMVWKSFFP